jgi:hypothetical protein
MKHTSDRVKVAALIILLVPCLTSTGMWAQPLSSSLDQTSLINPSFESGNFSGYTSLDELSEDGGPPPPPPINIVESQSQNLSMTRDAVALTATAGDFFAVLHTVRHPYELRHSIVVQDRFKITPAATHLQVDLNFLSNEIDTGAATNDTAWVCLTIEETGQVIPVAFFTRDQLQPGGTGQPAVQTVRSVGGFKLSTGWRTYEIDLSKYIGMSGFLSFNVRKAAPVLNFESQDTALAIDAIRLTN